MSDCTTAYLLMKYENYLHKTIIIAQNVKYSENHVNTAKNVWTGENDVKDIDCLICWK